MASDCCWVVGNFDSECRFAMKIPPKKREPPHAQAALIVWHQIVFHANRWEIRKLFVSSRNLVMNRPKSSLTSQFVESDRCACWANGIAETQQEPLIRRASNVFECLWIPQFGIGRLQRSVGSLRSFRRIVGSEKCISSRLLSSVRTLEFRFPRF